MTSLNEHKSARFCQFLTRALCRSLLFALALFALGHPSVFAQERWHKVQDGKLMGIGGMALLSRERDDLSFLVVHDNKKHDQPRAGILRCKRNGEVKYDQLNWSGELPKDLEALTSIPNTSGEYLAVTSAGKAYRIKVQTSSKELQVVQQFDIPGAKQMGEIEGFGLAALGKTIVAAWADRGDGEKPATFSWGTFNSEQNELTADGSTKIMVPWPENARDVSDIRIDNAGAVFISSAYESDDHFASAVYMAGVLKCDAEKTSFSQDKLTELFRFEGRKIEALELVSGPKGGLVMATDDENRGSSVYLDWQR
jgi:hypothetical protein